MAIAIPSIIQHKLSSVREKGVRTIVKNHLDSWIGWVRVNNEYIGRMVELQGNRVRIEGLEFSVDNPNIPLGQKGTLYFGLHELDELALLQQWLPRNLPLIELGGGLGVVSCVANRLLDPNVAHVVVEANLSLIQLLERNRDLNGCGFGVVPKAIAYDRDSVQLVLGDSFVSSKVGLADSPDLRSGATLHVASTNIAKLIDEIGGGPVSIVSDIEGSEADIVDNELDCIARNVDFLLIETHPRVVGEERIRDLVSRLNDVGLPRKDCRGDNMVLRVAVEE